MAKPLFAHRRAASLTGGRVFFTATLRDLVGTADQPIEFDPVVSNGEWIVTHGDFTFTCRACDAAEAKFKAARKFTGTTSGAQFTAFLAFATVLCTVPTTRRSAVTR